MSAVLGAGAVVPGSGWAFHITALHTVPAAPPWFTGTWHRNGDRGPDEACALWLTLAREPGNTLAVTLLADHTTIPGTVRQLAHHRELTPPMWTFAIAPTVAAHPWTTRLDHQPRPAAHRAARAVLAYLITHP